MTALATVDLRRRATAIDTGLLETPNTALDVESLGMNHLKSHDGLQLDCKAFERVGRYETTG
jgi:hypothetical protein